MGNALMTANAPIRKGSRAKSTNGTVLVPIVSRDYRDDSAAQTYFPLFTSKDGQPATGHNSTSNKYEKGATDVFYGICVSIDPLKKSSYTRTKNEFMRYNVCTRGVYRAPHNWLYEEDVDEDDEVMLKPYSGMSGLLYYSKEREYIHCKPLSFCFDADFAKEKDERDICIGQFFDRAAAFSGPDMGPERNVQTHVKKCKGIHEYASQQGSAKQRRQDSRTFRAFLRV